MDGKKGRREKKSVLKEVRKARRNDGSKEEKQKGTTVEYLRQMKKCK